MMLPTTCFMYYICNRLLHIVHLHREKSIRISCPVSYSLLQCDKHIIRSRIFWQACEGCIFVTQTPRQASWTQLEKKQEVVYDTQEGPGLIGGYKNDRTSLGGSCSDGLIWDQFCLLCLLVLDQHWRATFTLIVRELCVCMNTHICVFVSEGRLAGSRFRGHSPHRGRWRRTCSQELPGWRQGRCKASCGRCSTRPGQEGAHAAAHLPGYSSAWGESYSFGY